MSHAPQHTRRAHPCWRIGKIDKTEANRKEHRAHAQGYQRCRTERLQEGNEREAYREDTNQHEWNEENEHVQSVTGQETNKLWACNLTKGDLLCANKCALSYREHPGRDRCAEKASRDSDTPETEENVLTSVNRCATDGDRHKHANESYHRNGE
jgi:hypothetical protein